MTNEYLGPVEREEGQRRYLCVNLGDPRSVKVHEASFGTRVEILVTPDSLDTFKIHLTGFSQWLCPSFKGGVKVRT